MASLEKILMPEQFFGTLPDGREIAVPVRRSVRCKRLILRSVGSSFEVVIPNRCSVNDAAVFFYSNLDWIFLTIQKQEQYLRAHPPRSKSLPDEIFLSFTGERFTIAREPAEVCWTGARSENGTLILSGQVGTEEQCTAALRSWLIRHAETTLLSHAENIASNHGFTGLTKLRTGLQKRTWGTCNRKGVVTLNAALLFFTKALAEYVILHEFCHLSELNHSERFWAKLELVYPGAKEAREALKSASELLPGWVIS